MHSNHGIIFLPEAIAGTSLERSVSLKLLKFSSSEVYTEEECLGYHFALLIEDYNSYSMLSQREEHFRLFKMIPVSMEPK